MNEVDAHFQAALVLAELTFDRAWGEEEAKAAALAERQALELELQIAKAAFTSGKPPAPRPSAKVTAVEAYGLPRREKKGARTSGGGGRAQGSRIPGGRGSGGVGSQGRQNPFERHLIAELDAMLPNPKPNSKPNPRPNVKPHLKPLRGASSPHLCGSAPAPGAVPGAAKAAPAAALRRSTSAATYTTHTTTYTTQFEQPTRPSAVAARRGDPGAQGA